MAESMHELSRRRCEACTGRTPALAQDQIEAHLAALSDWHRDGAAIERAFTFRDYYQVIAFVNAVAWIAHREDHHPEMTVGYKRCVVRFTTHVIGALSENDFICAAKVSALVDEAAA